MFARAYNRKIIFGEASRSGVNNDFCIIICKRAYWFRKYYFYISPNLSYLFYQKKHFILLLRSKTYLMLLTQFCKVLIISEILKIKCGKTFVRLLNQCFCSIICNFVLIVRDTYIQKHFCMSLYLWRIQLIFHRIYFLKWLSYRQ